jgi:hypothetical protein
MIKSIKKQDLFGHPVALSFNQQGNTHNTLCGGLLSLLIKLFIFFYFLLLVKKLHWHEDDKNESFEEPLDLYKEEPVLLNETSINLYMYL